MSKEIEFVCVNSAVPGGTPQRLQTKLFKRLASIPGVLVYRQDFSDRWHREISMAAIIVDDSEETEQAVRVEADHLGVEVDLESRVSDQKIAEILDQNLEGLKDYGFLPPSES